MGCIALFAKFFLCFFNFIFFIAGGAALAVGIWLIVDISTFTNLISKIDESDVLKYKRIPISKVFFLLQTKTDPDVIKTISYILIIVGALTFIVSFLGYCGAMFESRCLLCIYGILILVVLILECTVVGLSFSWNSETEQGVRTLLKATMKYYATNEDKTEAVTVAWDGIMNQVIKTNFDAACRIQNSFFLVQKDIDIFFMKCCGVDNYTDFSQSPNWSMIEKKVPEACCNKINGILQDSNCPTNPSLSNSYYMQGCYNAIINSIQENAAIAIGVAVVLVFVELIVIILALYLACCYWRPQHGKDKSLIIYKKLIFIFC
ncbi:GSCOCG00011040001-RA-CDS [Cotesia congregata]|nr:GSCOCG00011040001-RA-CDS [Cotesia congregata]